MNKKGAVEKVKGAINLVAQASVQMALGGLAAAVIPGNICVVYKVAYYIGAAALASCVSKPVKEAVDEQFEQAKDVIEETKRNIATLAEKEVKPTKD